MVRSVYPCLFVSALLIGACSSSETAAPGPTDSSAGPSADSGVAQPVDAAVFADAAAAVDAGFPDSGVLPFTLTSTAFNEGGTVPLRYECGPPLQGPGENVSPQLAWTAGPAGTRSYAVVVRDIDARIPAFPEGIIHWVIYDIPADVFELPEDVAANYDVAEVRGAHQANIQNSGFFGYFGPCSPNRVNTYVWTVHALAEPEIPNVSRMSSESDIAGIIEATSLAQASLSGES